MQAPTSQMPGLVALSRRDRISFLACESALQECVNNPHRDCGFFHIRWSFAGHVLDI